MRTGLRSSSAEPATAAATKANEDTATATAIRVSLTTRAGTVTVRRPRVRGLEQRFQSALLPLFARRTPAVNELLPELYLHGLALGDFELSLRGLFGEGAPLSASTVARVEERWHQEAAAWQERSLADLEVEFLWVDGV